MKIFAVVAASMALACSEAFSVLPSASVGHRPLTTTTMLAAADSRRTFLSSSVAAVMALALFGESAQAVTGLKKVNAQLAGYGLPLIDKVEDGLTPLLVLYGKGVNRFPILVEYQYPVTWVVTLPSNTVNGEDGTIQSGDYGKGDTATFFVYNEAGHVNNIQAAGKDLYETVLQKCISQKGDNMYQNFKITKMVPGPTPEYVIVDFKYQLLTGAGFEVDRKGIASITSQGPAVEVLWAASTTVRFKKTEDTLRAIVNSFRCYTEGIQFSSELREAPADLSL
jgi:hypothetical protein